MPPTRFHSSVPSTLRLAAVPVAGLSLTRDVEPTDQVSNQTTVHSALDQIKAP